MPYLVVGVRYAWLCGHLSYSVVGPVIACYFAMPCSDHFWCVVGGRLGHRWGGWFSVCSGQSHVARFIQFDVAHAPPSHLYLCTLCDMLVRSISEGNVFSWLL